MSTPSALQYGIVPAIHAGASRVRTVRSVFMLRNAQHDNTASVPKLSTLCACARKVLELKECDLTKACARHVA